MIGNQKPTFKTCPKYKETAGKDAGELAKCYGLTPDDWQQDILNDWLAIGSDSKYISKTCGLSVPRQNGKNGELEMRVLYGMAILGESFLFTAHEVKTAKEAFLRLCSFFENERQYPELAEMVIDIKRGNGQESIKLNNGASIKYSARSRGSARGFTVDVVIFDEAQELTDEQSQAIIPTLSASPLKNRQFIYTGTPPPPTAPGEVFTRIRNRAHEEENNKSLCWHEWSVEEIGDVTDKKRWYATNPAMGIRIEEEAIEEECRSLSKEGFARERLGWWSSIQYSFLFTEEQWQSYKAPKALFWGDGRVSCGVKFSVDGNNFAVCMAVEGEEYTYLELPADLYGMGNGVVQIAEFLIANKHKIANVVIDGQACAGSLYDAIKRELSAKQVLLPNAMQVAICASL